MARARVQAFIRDEAGNKLGGTGYEVRFYQAGTNTLQTLYPDGTSGSTIPNPHYPNSGVQTTLTSATLTTDTVINVASVASLQQGDFITLDNGTTRTERVILSIAALAVTLNAAVGTAYATNNTRVNGRENLGHVAAYCDTALDIEMTVKNVSTGIEGPRELFRIGGIFVTKLDEFVLGVATAAVDFLSIPAGYRKLMVDVMGRHDTVAVVSDLVFVRFNNDTGANYDDQRMQTNGAATTFDETNAGNYLRVGGLPAANAVANQAGAISMDILNYAGTTFLKQLIARNSYDTTNALAGHFAGLFGGHWRSTAAINRITVGSVTSKLLAGTTITLYGAP